MIRLKEIYDKTTKINISDEDKIVVFSDLHMGNGGRNDDFSKNASLFNSILTDYYLPRGYKLILNGDIEELYKFSYKSIYKKWRETYKIFDQFHENGELFKIYGNHDYQLALNQRLKKIYPLYETLCLDYKNNEIFIFHGHQTSSFMEQYSKLAFFSVKFLFRNVKNCSLPINNNKKFRTESIAYQFSKQNGLISILGHTHRPLFESRSKIDYLKNTIENLITKYYRAEDSRKEIIYDQIRWYKTELDRICANHNNNSRKSHFRLRNSLYNSDFVVPCLFNSGAVTGKRGITGIEIKKGTISLVYWFDVNRSKRYLNYQGVKCKKLPNSDYYKATLKKDSLDYIFTRIKTLF